MAFEWDAAKNAANIAKHGIDFEDAIRIFDGPVLEKADARRDYGEARIIAFVSLTTTSWRSFTPCAAHAAGLYRRGEHIVVSAKNIVRRTPSSRRRGKTDWVRVGAISDHEIENAAKADPDAAPILDKEWFRTAKLVLPERKVPISLRMDREVVEWFKAHGRRYQSRMNAVLKAYVQAHRKAG
jgi:uncharacterized protein (DUF4415 family)/uncharacterized DUF497 family protein